MADHEKQNAGFPSGAVQRGLGPEKLLGTPQVTVCSIMYETEGVHPSGQCDIQAKLGVLRGHHPLKRTRLASIVQRLAGRFLVGQIGRSYTRRL